MLRPNELELAANLPADGCTPEAAQQYTRWLATHHYENFNVVSWLLPRELHQHFYNLYAYCRWADDLGDEIPERDRALELLGWWERELDDCYAGRPAHPVFVALRQTILAKDIPRQPFADLLKAFRQDQVIKRYPTWESMIGYCVYSANPVGRLVLYLCGYRDEERQLLSDAICTALQLANFWQDVARDLEKGRIYIPLDIADAHGVSESDIVNRRFSESYVALMKNLIARTRALFAQGAPLAGMVQGRISVDLDMFTRGGVAVLDAIEAMGYDTLHRRPSISKGKQARLLGHAILSTLFGGAAQQQPRRASDSSTGAPQSGHGDVHGDGNTRGGNRAKSEPAGLQLIPPEGILQSISNSYDHCYAIARAAHSNFYYAFFLLPKPRRDALAALYAFNRLVDDVADEGDDVAVKQRNLAKWRAALDEAVSGLDQCFDGTAALPLDDPPKHADQILLALGDAICRYKMPARYLHDLISGAEMDLTVRTYSTFDRLREYCYRVAGTVGLTCTHIFGFTEPRALDLAEKFGLAFQLTNIIRDVHEDYALGRVYIPEEDLAHFGVSAQDFGRNEATLGIRELLRFEADRAWRNYEEGAELFNLVDPDSRPTLWLLAHTYSALLSRIEALDFAVFGERVRLSKAEKMLFIAKAKFGRLSKENILEKRDRDRRRAGGFGGQRRAG